MSNKLSTTQSFSSGDQVTHTTLNNIISGAQLTTHSTDSTINCTSGGVISVADTSIAVGKLANNAVETAKIKDSTGTSDGVTFPKIRQLANLKVMGNVSGSSAVPAEVTINDTDAMSDASATTLATSESIKAYADSVTTFSPTIATGMVSGTKSVTLPNGLIMKFGTVATSGATSTTIDLSSESADFPNQIYSVQLQAFDSDATAALAVTLKTASTAEIVTFQGTAVTNIHYFALGR